MFGGLPGVSINIKVSCLPVNYFGFYQRSLARHLRYVTLPSRCNYDAFYYSRHKEKTLKAIYTKMILPNLASPPLRVIEAMFEALSAPPTLPSPPPQAAPSTPSRPPSLSPIRLHKQLVNLYPHGVLMWYRFLSFFASLTKGLNDSEFTTNIDAIMVALAGAGARTPAGSSYSPSPVRKGRGIPAVKDDPCSEADQVSALRRSPAVPPPPTARVPRTKIPFSVPAAVAVPATTATSIPIIKGTLNPPPPPPPPPNLPPPNLPSPKAALRDFIKSKPHLSAILSEAEVAELLSATLEELEGVLRYSQQGTPSRSGADDANGDVNGGDNLDAGAAADAGAIIAEDADALQVRKSTM